MNNRDRLFTSSRLLVRIGIVLNRVFLAAVGLALIGSFVAPGLFRMLLSQPAAQQGAVMAGIRWLLVIGIVMAGATDRLLTALAGVVRSASEGDPFVTANARRLRMIGWCLVVLQLLDAAGAVVAWAFPDLGSAAPTQGAFSAGGWLAVLMVFVLARVFAAGADMRDDLAGTV